MIGGRFLPTASGRRLFLQNMIHIVGWYMMRPNVGTEVYERLGYSARMKMW